MATAHKDYGRMNFKTGYGHDKKIPFLAVQILYVGRLSFDPAHSGKPFKLGSQCCPTGKQPGGHGDP